MSDTARDYQTSPPVDANSWDDFFSSESGDLSACPDTKPGQHKICPDSWLTLAQAAIYFSVNEKTLRRWIKQNRVKAFKISGPRGEEWRLEPGQPRTSKVGSKPGLKVETPGILPIEPTDLVNAEVAPAQSLGSYTSDVEFVEEMPGLDFECPDMSSLDTDLGATFLQSEKYQELVELRAKLSIFQRENQELKGQLQGATYRNGYLESKLEDREQQIRLLTDSQHKGGWWAKFSSWFFKGK